MKTSGIGASVLLCALVVLVCGCEDKKKPLGHNHDFGDNDKNVISAIGDSMTAAGWPAILAEMSGKDVRNRGHGGDKSTEALRVVGGVLASDKPGFLLIQYGANDVIHRFNKQYTVENLRKVIQAAKDNKTIPVIATVTPMYTDYQVFSASAISLNKSMRIMAQEEGIKVADLEHAFGDRRELIDKYGLHATEAGNRETAATFYDVLK